MSKKTLFLPAFALLTTATIASAQDGIEKESLVLLDTNKTVEETKPKQKAKIEPTYNITNVLNVEPSDGEDSTDVYFSADEVQNDANTDIVTASGNVEIIRQNLTLNADKVKYNRNTGQITALGHVVLLEKNGNTIYADEINLSDHLQEVDVQNIRVILLDKTRLAASSFHKKANDRKILRKAIYSPCDVCDEKSPLWQIKSRKVLHDPIGQNVEYQHAFLEIKDVPVFYSPYFSHPDPSVKHRSGFLFPRFLSNNYLGAAVQPQYFWDISPHENIIFNPIISTDKDPVYSMILSKYFYRGELNASGTFLQDKDEKKKENRGNLFLFGRYEINDYWVADTDINYASDHNYLKDMSLPKKDDSWLTSRIRFQAFDNRDYASIEGYYYDLLSYNLQKSNKPSIFPLMTYENYTTPDRFGSYFKTILSTASVYHKEDDASQRATMINSWNLPYTSPFGEKYKIVASLKSDLYYVNKYHNPKDEYYTGTAGRMFPQLGLEWRLPFIKNTENTSQILEPIIVAAAAPEQDNKPNKIPNYDSNDVELTDVNIFDLDRYSGYDRNDTGSRVSYGLNWSFYGKRWGRSTALFAQSYEFNKDENLLNQANERSHFSDYVGRIYSAPSEYFDINYRFKVDKDDYDINYSELSASTGTDVLRFYTSYIYFPDANEASIYNYGRREEIYLSAYSKITRDWALSVFERYDIVRKETISRGGSIIYEDECSRFAFTAERDFSIDPDASDDISFYFSFFLKTLGGFGNK